MEFFFNENVWISINISLKFVPRGPINNIPALVQVMAWCRPGDKPLSEPMMVRLPTHICVSRPQWVNGSVMPYFYQNWFLRIQLLKPRLHYTRRDATRLGRMIGFQWNQQDRSHYARRDGTRLRRPNWLLYPNNRAESRSKRDSVGYRHQRNNKLYLMIMKWPREYSNRPTSRVDTSANFNQYPPVWRIRISRNVFVWLRNGYGCNFLGNVSQVNTMSSWIKTPIKVT